MPTEFRLPKFYPIIDTIVLAGAGLSPIEVAEATISAGARILQYRHKDKWTQTEFDEAEVIASFCRKSGVSFVINDRADFARLVAAGLHIGQDDLPPAAARSLLPDSIIGFSTHNSEQLRLAVGAPVDYLSLGPIFVTKSKEKPDPVVGLEGLRALRSLTLKPLVAIGGITLENASDVLSAGADSVAVISGILQLNTLSAWCCL